MPPNTQSFDPADIPAIDAKSPGQPAYRIGQGWDRHRLANRSTTPTTPDATGQPVRPLKLAGITLDSNLGVIAHSDGDVLLHAITDAILAACGAPDLGSLFPDHDQTHDNQNSAEFLQAAAAILKHRGWTIANLDATVILQTPRIATHREAIRSRVAEILAVPEVMISLKGKSGEHVDAVGESRAIEAMAIVLISRGKTL